MDLGVLAGVQLADWLIIIFFLGFFVLGFAQGTIRRLIGLASILFSFLLAANLADPLGAVPQAQNWTDQNPKYSYMVGFLTVFVAASLAFAIVIQGFYRPQPLFEKARFVDELIGGALGVLQAAVILGAFIDHPRHVLPAERPADRQRAAVPARLLGVPRFVADRRLLPVDPDTGVLHPVRVPHPGQDRGDVPA